MKFWRSRTAPEIFWFCFSHLRYTLIYHLDAYLSISPGDTFLPTQATFTICKPAVSISILLSLYTLWAFTLNINELHLHLYLPTCRIPKSHERDMWHRLLGELASMQFKSGLFASTLILMATFSHIINYLCLNDNGNRYAFLIWVILWKRANCGTWMN